MVEHDPETADEAPGTKDRVIARVDEFQQSHAGVALPVAVWKKFSEDEAGKLASLIAYYAFISIFPLLIVLATVVSRVLVGQPELADQIVSTAAGSFLSIGASGDVQPLQVSGFALAIGIAVALWSGLAVAHNMQDSMNTVYEVPKTERPGFVPRILRSITLLVIVGVGLPLTTVVQGLAGQWITGVVWTVAGLAFALVLNTGLIAAAFRRATVAETTWRGVLPGAAIAAVAWSVMQALATTLLTNRVEGAQQNYGQFALVIGLLFWFFTLAQITLYCAELNMVLSHRLWPRGLKSIVEGKADTDADVAAYSGYPKREQQATNIAVSVDRTADDDQTAGDSTGTAAEAETPPDRNWVDVATGPGPGPTVDLTRREPGVLVTHTAGNHLDMTMMYAIHSAFRRDLDRLTTMAERRDPNRPVVTRGWETMKAALTVHHHSEDEGLWPIARSHLAGREDDLLILDAMEAEHETLHPLIEELDAQLASGTDDERLAEAAAAFRDGLIAHLAHEERDALPVLDRAISQQEWQGFEDQQGKRYGLRLTFDLLPWITEEPGPTTDRILREMPLPMRLLNQLVLAPRYRKQQRW